MRSPGSEASTDGDIVAPVGIEEALGRARPLLGTGLLLLASDFDGTLARLSPDPWAARIIPAAQRALRRLASVPQVHVALISGRTVADLADRTRLGGISYRGDHGAERAEAARGARLARLHVEHEPVPDADRRLVSRLAAAVPRAVPAPWLVVERKRAAVTFHFRGAPDVAAAASQVATAVDAVDPDRTLARDAGRRALELRPRGAVTKATTLRALIDGLRPAAVIMLGDDPHDARAFEVIRAARAVGEVDGLAVAVAGRADVTARVAPHADLLLRSPMDVARFLGRLAATRPGP